MLVCYLQLFITSFDMLHGSDVSISGIAQISICGRVHMNYLTHLQYCFGIPAK